MIGTIRKHSKWLWSILIAATIISFVYLFSPSNRMGNDDSGPSDVNFGSVFGDSITREQYLAADRDAMIIYRINNGQWPTTSDQKKSLNSIVQQRLLLNAELGQYHIAPTEEAAARFIRQFLGIKPTDVAPADKIMETLQRIGSDGGVTPDDFNRFAKHQVGQEYLMALVGMSGRLITPQEGEVFYRRDNTPMVTELVNFPSANYESAVTVAATNIDEFYAKNQSAYRIPEKIQVNYVSFANTAYVPKVEKDLGTNLNDRVDQAYLQEGATAFKDKNGAQMSAEAAKAKIKDEIIQYTALTVANSNATVFLNELSKGHDDDHPYSRDDIFKLAKAHNLTVQTSAPFDMATGPKDFDVPPKLVHSLFDMSDTDPDDKEHSEIYGPLVTGSNAVYVIGLDKRFPSRVQPLSDVRAQVEKDYKQAASVEIAHAAGKRFESELEAGLSQGKTFDTMCAAQFVHPQKLDPFSLVSTNIPNLADRTQAEQVMEVAARMQPSQVSPFIPTEQGGFILYYKGDLPVNPELIKAGLPDFMSRMRDKLQIAAFSAWFNKEYQLHFVPGPALRAGG